MSALAALIIEQKLEDTLRKKYQMTNDGVF